MAMASSSGSVLRPDGVDLALDVAGSGVLPELIELAGGPEHVVTIADFAGAREHGVRFSAAGTAAARCMRSPRSARADRSPAACPSWWRRRSRSPRSQKRTASARTGSRGREACAGGRRSLRRAGESAFSEREQALDRDAGDEAAFLVVLVQRCGPTGEPAVAHLDRSVRGGTPRGGWRGRCNTLAHRLRSGALDQNDTVMVTERPGLTTSLTRSARTGLHAEISRMERWSGKMTARIPIPRLQVHGGQISASVVPEP